MKTLLIAICLVLCTFSLSFAERALYCSVLSDYAGGIILMRQRGAYKVEALETIPPSTPETAGAIEDMTMIVYLAYMVDFKSGILEKQIVQGAFKDSVCKYCNEGKLFNH